MYYRISIFDLLFASSDEYSVKDNNEKEEEEAANTGNISNEEYVRDKRFYPVPVNVGCIKGAQCCYDPHCRAFCSLCYGKNNQYELEVTFFSLLFNEMLR